MNRLGPRSAVAVVVSVVMFVCSTQVRRETLGQGHFNYIIETFFWARATPYTQTKTVEIKTTQTEATTLLQQFIKQKNFFFNRGKPWKRLAGATLRRW